MSNDIVQQMEAKKFYSAYVFIILEMVWILTQYKLKYVINYKEFKLIFEWFNITEWHLVQTLKCCVLKYTLSYGLTLMDEFQHFY